jgi:hypothetical protein
MAVAEVEQVDTQLDIAAVAPQEPPVISSIKAAKVAAA